ncbi:MAG: hypothetical protein KDB88_09930 [Flavobacteriales bacterium]|nr:hypothetical protein [Flavobacteriales bacterium]
MKFSSLFTLVVALLAGLQGMSQGCVAIRGFTSCSPSSFTNANLIGKGWQLSTNYRYFESFRHFRGTHEEEDRLTDKTEVINYTTQFSLGLTYNFDRRKGLSVVLPFSYFVRSSLYEHGRTERHTSRASGLGDVRVSYNYWLWNPDSLTKGNLMVSAGVKLPTGNYNARDYFYNVGPDTLGEYRPVDQSIQPGDGGLGFSLELQGYVKLTRQLFLYGNAFYLFNPMEMNGTRTYRETLNAILINESIMSVTDQYMARLGFNWNVAGSAWNIFAGGRIEGIPVEDLIGGSLGFRRPGYVMSVEPGIDWMRGRHDLNISVPIAVERNRLQSVTDKENSEITGNYRHGDAAFADWLLNITYTVRLGTGDVH